MIGRPYVIFCRKSREACALPTDPLSDGFSLPRSAAPERVERPGQQRDAGENERPDPGVDAVAARARRAGLRRERLRRGHVLRQRPARPRAATCRTASIAVRASASASSGGTAIPRRSDRPSPPGKGWSRPARTCLPATPKPFGVTMITGASTGKKSSSSRTTSSAYACGSASGSRLAAGVGLVRDHRHLDRIAAPVDRLDEAEELQLDVLRRRQPDRGERGSASRGSGSSGRRGVRRPRRWPAPRARPRSERRGRHGPWRPRCVLASQSYCLSPVMMSALI